MTVRVTSVRGTAGRAIGRRPHGGAGKPHTRGTGTNVPLRWRPPLAHHRRRHRCPRSASRSQATMVNLRRGAAAASVVAMLALAPTALASGGVNSGGVNSGGGGGTTTAPAPSSGACVTISSFSNSDGYYKIYAAIWTKFSIANSCSGPLHWRMTYTNGTTGVVDFSAGSSTPYMSSGTIDEDWAAFSTPYTVALTVTDPNTGDDLASTSAVVTTKVPKSAGA